eukprot:snap_masked-scaffold_54-processed-gene-0.17-mRNA-1 protein AED:0.15 eAED:0.15 QI:0/0/0/1/1/1/2/0/327
MEFKYITLIILIFQNTFLVLLLRYSRLPDNTTGYLYLTSTAVVVSEVIKLLISLCGMYFDFKGGEIKGHQKNFIMHVKDYLFTVDTLKISVPGLLYTIQNNLLLVALSNLDAAVYQVTYQLKILTTAFFTFFLLNKKLTVTQIISLFLLFIGVAIVQISQRKEQDKEDKKEQNMMLGLVCVLLACLSSGFAGVYFEKILKSGKKVSLYARNLQLSAFGIGAGLIVCFSKDGDIILERGFFQGYNYITLVVVLTQAASGFVIASVMKYADNILKGFATSLSIILSRSFIFGTGLVIGSVFLYGYRPQKKEPKIIRVDETSKLLQPEEV